MHPTGCVPKQRANPSSCLFFSFVCLFVYRIDTTFVFSSSSNAHSAAATARSSASSSSSSNQLALGGAVAIAAAVAAVYIWVATTNNDNMASTATTSTAPNGSSSAGAAATGPLQPTPTSGQAPNGHVDIPNLDHLGNPKSVMLVAGKRPYVTPKSNALACAVFV